MVQHKAPHRPWEPARGEAGRSRGRENSRSRRRCSTTTRIAARRPSKADMRIGQMKPAIDLKLWERDEPSRASCCISRMSDAERGGVGEARRSAAGSSFGRPIRRATTARGGSTSSIMKDYLRCVASVDDSVGQAARLSRRQRAGEEYDRGLHERPGLLPGRARLVRQAIHVRRVAAHAAGGSLAGRDCSRAASRTGSSRTSISRRRFWRRRGRRSPPTCKAAAWCRCCAASSPTIGGSRFYYHFYEDQATPITTWRSTKA